MYMVGCVYILEQRAVFEWSDEGRERVEKGWEIEAGEGGTEEALKYWKKEKEGRAGSTLGDRVATILENERLIDMESDIKEDKGQEGEPVSEVEDARKVENEEGVEKGYAAAHEYVRKRLPEGGGWRMMHEARRMKRRITFEKWMREEWPRYFEIEGEPEAAAMMRAKSHVEEEQGAEVRKISLDSPEALAWELMRVYREVTPAEEEVQEEGVVER